MCRKFATLFRDPPAGSVWGRVTLDVASLSPDLDADPAVAGPWQWLLARRGSIRRLCLHATVNFANAGQLAALLAVLEPLAQTAVQTSFTPELELYIRGCYASGLATRPGRGGIAILNTPLFQQPVLLQHFTSRITALQITTSTAINMAQLGRISQLPLLELLELEQVTRDAALTLPPAMLTGLSRLRSLSLTGPVDQLQDLARFGRLRAVGLVGAGLETFPQVICGLPQLRRVCLDGNELTALPEDISRLQHLRALQLRSNTFTELPVVQLATLPDLEYIDFSAQSEGVGIDSQTLSFLQGMAKLRVMNISRYYLWGAQEVFDISNADMLLQLQHVEGTHACLTQIFYLNDDDDTCIAEVLQEICLDCQDWDD